TIFRARRRCHFTVWSSLSILVYKNKTWDEALDYCRQNYTDLTSLRSHTIMAEVINNTITSQTAYVWTGLRFMAGHWFWVSGDDLQYKAWSTEGSSSVLPEICAVELCIEKRRFGNPQTERKDIIFTALSSHKCI
ncbi:hypothetical protein PO909_024401, partial [Leuciscus waleckii]